MSKVYLVYWCNNETYEDYCEGVQAVFSTREGAESYIIDNGYAPHVCENDWERKHLSHTYDSTPTEWGEYHSMWVKEVEVRE